MFATFGQNVAGEELDVERREVDEALIQVVRWKNPAEYCQKQLFAVAERLLGTPGYSRKKGLALLTRVKRHFSGVFSFTVLDAQGNPIPDWCDTVPSKTVLKRLFVSLEALDQGNAEPLQKDWKLLKSLLGPNALLNKLERDVLMLVSFQREKNWCFISRRWPGGILICHCNRVDEWESLGIRHAVERWNRKKSPVKLGIANIHSVTLENSGGKGPSIAQVRAIIDRLDRFPEAFQKRFNHLWSYRILSNHLRLLAWRPIAVTRASSGLNQSVLALGFLAFLLMCGIWGLPGRLLFHMRDVSLRWKLHVVFLTVAMASILFLGFGAFRYLRERQEYLENQLFQEIERVLEIFDRRFPVTIQETEKRIQAIVKKEIPVGASIQPAILKRLQVLFKVFQPSRLSFFDADGKIWVPPGGSPIHAGIEQLKNARKPLMGFIKAISNMNSQVEGAFRAELGRMSEDSDLTVEDFISELKVSLNRLQETDFGVRGLEYHGIFPMLDTAKKCLGLVFIDISDHRLQGAYVKKYLFRMARQMPNARFVAHPLKDSFEAIVAGTPGGFSADDSFWKGVQKKFHRRVLGGIGTLRERFDGSSVPSLWIGVKGKSLSHFSLTAMVSLKPIIAEMQVLRWRLLLYAFIFLFASVVFAILLSRNFLEPIGDLTHGINALENRDFTFRIPSREPDELGKLGMLFNNMMGEMADLEVAKTVQETLFPSSSLAIGNFSVYGRCVAATQVGGDYFDYMELPGSKIGFLIGDVSGHGIAAAIVMAMAKGVFSYPGFVKDPMQAIQDFNQVLMQGVKRKKMMTCLMGVVDVASGTIRMANAGHVNPMLISKGKGVYLESWGKPLGVSKRFQANVIECVLKPGDHLLLMTDGIPEASSKKGGQIGYSRLPLAIESLLTDDAMASEKAIRDWHRAECKHPVLEDDVSLLIISCRSLFVASKVPE